MMRKIQLVVDECASRVLEQGPGAVNEAGTSFREWLAIKLDKMAGASRQSSLFSRDYSVQPGVPGLLAAVGAMTKREPNDIVNEWARDKCIRAGENGDSDSAIDRSKVAELIDLAETLFEESVSDARLRLADYSEADEALKAAAGVFTALRHVLGLVPVDVEQRK